MENKYQANQNEQNSSRLTLKSDSWLLWKRGWGGGVGVRRIKGHKNSQSFIYIGHGYCSTARRIQAVVLQYLSMLTESNHTMRVEDLIKWMTVKALSCTLETNIRFYIDTCFKKNEVVSQI